MKKIEVDGEQFVAYSIMMELDRFSRRLRGVAGRIADTHPEDAARLYRWCVELMLLDLDDDGRRHVLAQNGYAYTRVGEM